MGRKVGITLDQVVAVATDIADRDGLAGMSLRRVADELGIKTPSLYAHVAGLPGLRRELALDAARRVGAIVANQDEGEGVPAVLRRVARQYRRFALDHPGLYQSLLPAPRPGDDDELYSTLAEPVVSLQGHLIAGGVPAEQTVHLIRALRSMIHGFVDLEMKDGFGMPENVEESFDRAVDVVVDGVLGPSSEAG
jgi:AcrR family transcriptional regulator